MALPTVFLTKPVSTLPGPVSYTHLDVYKRQNKDSVFTYPGGKHSSGAEDAAIVATHLMLAATNAAVDSCWINFFDPRCV